MKHWSSLLLALMLVAFGGLVYVQHEGDAATPKPNTVAIATKPPAEAPPKPAAPLARTLRTVSLGWEQLAPGVVADKAFKAAKLETTFTSVATIEDVEAALAKGGGEATGADLAIVPLSSYVASYEKLRALSLDVVFVVGWSRREAIYGPDLAVLAKQQGRARLAAPAKAPETFFALFLLDLAGVPASKVELTSSGSLVASTRVAKTKPSGKLVITSADTPTLMPIVAVAPRGFIAKHKTELEAWARAWLEGVDELATDVPAGGRLVAALPGAPPVVGIIEGLGQIEFANLRENAVAVGLAGRGALDLDDIFKTTWRIWRDAGVITTPPPEAVPLYTEVVASLVRADPKSVVEVDRPRAPAGKRPAVILVVKHEGKLEPDAFIERIGHVAAVFDRMPLRVSIKNDAKTAQLLADTARERFGLRAQITTDKRATQIEVLTQ